MTDRVVESCKYVGGGEGGGGIEEEVSKQDSLHQGG